MATTFEVFTGDPKRERNGLYRGRIKYTLDDGRTRRKQIVAPTLEAWQTKRDEFIAKVEKEVENEDAEKDINKDSAISDVGFARAEKRAVSYLRHALEAEDVWEGFQLIQRFVEFVESRGWQFSEVRDRLQAYGLEEEDWITARNVYTYLNTQQRKSVMSKYAEFQEYWNNK